METSHCAFVVLQIKPAKMFECAKCPAGEYQAIMKTSIINHLIKVHGETEGLETSESVKKYTCEHCDSRSVHLCKTNQVCFFWLFFWLKGESMTPL